MNKFGHHFTGISIILPDANMIAIDKGIENPEIIKKKSKGFIPFRIIGNVCVYYSNDRKNPIQRFKEPIEVIVGYDQFDAMQCGGSVKNLKLAYWDGEQWVVVSNPEHDYQILPSSTGQIAKFTIKEWAGDPPLAWGR